MRRRTIRCRVWVRSARRCAGRSSLVSPMWSCTGPGRPNRTGDTNRSSNTSPKRYFRRCNGPDRGSRAVRSAARVWQRIMMVDSRRTSSRTVMRDTSDTAVSGGHSATGHAAQRRRDGTLPAVVGLAMATRPRQWVKSVLVFAAPFTAGEITNGVVLLSALVAAVAFTLAAAAVYLVNDVIDLDADRAHPTKRHRPIASGTVPVPAAVATAVVLFGGSVAVSVLADWRLTAVIGVYVLAQLGYCFGLKHQPVVDLAIVASGFLLRA